MVGAQEPLRGLCSRVSPAGKRDQEDRPGGSAATLRQPTAEPGVRQVLEQGAGQELVESEQRFLVPVVLRGQKKAGHLPVGHLVHHREHGFGAAGGAQNAAYPAPASAAREAAGAHQQADLAPFPAPARKGPGDAVPYGAQQPAAQSIGRGCGAAAQCPQENLQPSLTPLSAVQAHLLVGVVAQDVRAGRAAVPGVLPHVGDGVPQGPEPRKAIWCHVRGQAKGEPPGGGTAEQVAVVHGSDEGVGDQLLVPAAPKRVLQRAEHPPDPAVVLGVVALDVQDDQRRSMRQRVPLGGRHGLPELPDELVGSLVVREPARRSVTYGHRNPLTAPSEGRPGRPSCAGIEEATKGDSAFTELR